FWCTFLIPIGFALVLAVVTGMSWFLLFSISAPISGSVAYLVEKRRYARDCEQCRRERHAAESEARSRLSELEAAQRRTVFASAGLCLVFLAILSYLAIADQLQGGVD